MTVLIGTDEAGYGPNLGPLVVSASFWRFVDDTADMDLYRRLQGVVKSFVDPGTGSTNVAIADSKLLYKPGDGLANLERGVLPLVDLPADRLSRWKDVWLALDPQCAGRLASIPWYCEFESSIPCDIESADVARLRAMLNDEFVRSRVRCERIRSTVVFPEDLNDLIDLHGNKATALSMVTLSLVRSLIADGDDSRVVVHCDKHGGRNKYGPLLQQAFPDYLVEILQESREESIYCWGPAARRVEFRFSAKGERCLASALASMTSKYLRELAMMAFNEFWCRHVPGLRRTAGYPVDAKRFKAEIQAAQQQLGVADRVLWRNR